MVPLSNHCTSFIKVLKCVAEVGGLVWVFFYLKTSTASGVQNWAAGSPCAAELLAVRSLLSCKSELREV